MNMLWPSHPSISNRQSLTKGIIVSQDINVLALLKGEERYIFLFNDKNRKETLRMLGRYASNPNLSFTWYDAAVMSQKVRTLTNLERIMDSRQQLPS